MDILHEKDLCYFEDPQAHSSLAEIMGLSGPLHRRAYSLAETRLQKGGTVIRHHHNASEEIYLFTAGHCVMQVDDARINAAPGTVIAIQVGERHEILPTAEDVVFYALSIPPYQPEDFIAEGDAE